jgi:hypothetical protein
MRYELRIPETAPSPNCYVRAHWSVYSKIKQHWYWLILEALQASGKPRERLEKARVTIVRYGRNKLDRDNLYGSTKPIADALIVNGFIRDDSEDHIDLQVRQGTLPKGALPCTLIEIVALTA